MKRILNSCMFAIVLCATGLVLQAHSQEPISFSKQVAPILLEHCVACHGAKRAEGGYRLDSLEHMQRPGDGASQPFVPAQSAASELVSRIRSHDPDLRMPADSEPLPPQQIELIAKWIDEGANLNEVSLTDPLWLVIPPAEYPASPPHYPNSLPITALAFSEDGTQLLTSGYHETLVWNVADGSLVRRIANQVQRTYALVPIQHGGMLAVAGGSPGAIGELRLVDPATGSVKSIIARANDIVTDVAVRPGKNELAVAIADNTIRLIDLDTMQQRLVIASHADYVTQLAFSGDGKRLGSASKDKSAKVHDADSGELIVSYSGHPAAVRGIAAIGDGAQWVTAGADNKWQRWEVEGAKKVAEVALGGEPSKLLMVGTTVIVPCSDKHWYRIDLGNNALSLKQPGHSDWLLSAAYHAPTSRLATGGLDGSIHIWNLQDGSLVTSIVAKP